MKRSNLSTIERMIVLAFPIAIFAGCAGSGDTKAVLSEPQLSNETAYEQPVVNNDMEDISVAYRADTSNDIETAEIPLSQENSENPAKGTTVTANPESTTLPPGMDISSIEKIYYFDTNKYEITDTIMEQLEYHAKYLLANPDTRLVINGHADERGTESYNQTLSEKRAGAIFDTLVKLGVPQQQLSRFGHGETLPLSNVNAWDENRRVELDYESPVIVSEK